MSRVVFFSFPGHGHTNPSLGLVRELVNRGEEVVYFSTDEFKTKIEQTGSTFCDYGEDLDMLLNSIQGKEGKLVYLAHRFLETSMKIIPDILNQLENNKPDYIIFDSMCVWGRLISEILGIPSISSITMFPFFKGYKSVASKFIMNIIFYMLIEQSYDGKIHYLCRLKNLSKAIKIKYNVKNLRLVDILTNYGNLNIVYTSKFFQPISSVFDNSFKFIGPSIIAREEKNDFPFHKLENKKVIYISLGTVGNDKLEFYNKCFEAFGNLSCQIILSVGNKVKIDTLNNIPDNFIVRNSVPQLEILKKSDLFITHGGMNSVSEALYFGVPLIVIPFSSDQPTVAGQVKKFGAGIFLNKNKISAKSLRESADMILKDKSFKENSNRIGETFKSSGGYKRAVDEIFEFKSNTNKLT